jgi:predicted nucleic acid-binding protein
VAGLALDSDAVIGFLDRSDAHHREALNTISAHVTGFGSHSGPVVVSVITYAEVITGALLGHYDEALVRGFFRDLVSEVVEIDLDIAETAARLRARNTDLRLPDALVVATAELYPDVDSLFTGDRKVAKVKGAAIRINRMGR